MDALDFAKSMIKYEELTRELQMLERIIERYVLERGETQAIGNVKARYANGRTSYDYEKTVMNLPGVTTDHPKVEKHKQIKITYDWRKICLEEFKFPATDVLIAKEPVPYVKIEVS